MWWGTWNLGPWYRRTPYHFLSLFTVPWGEVTPTRKCTTMQEAKLWEKLWLSGKIKDRYYLGARECGRTPTEKWGGEGDTLIPCVNWEKFWVHPLAVWNQNLKTQQIAFPPWKTRQNLMYESKHVFVCPIHSYRSPKKWLLLFHPPKNIYIQAKSLELSNVSLFGNRIFVDVINYVSWGGIILDYLCGL